MSKAQQLALVALIVFSAASFECPAWEWDDCKYSAQRESALDVSGAKRVEVLARAGSLTVVGSPGATRVESKGRACASEEEFLQSLQIETTRSGDTIIVKVLVPDQGRAEERFFGSTYASLDLEVTLPADLPVRVTDSSGDAEVRGVASVDVTDSSGDLRVRDIAGDVSARDSSGGLRLEHVGGSVRLSDSSGDVEVDDVKGGVQVDVDSSGDLVITRVVGDIYIAQDSSGEIRVSDVGGGVNIGSDSSGDIDVRRVKGGFKLGSKGSGDVHQTEVEGEVSVSR